YRLSRSDVVSFADQGEIARTLEHCFPTHIKTYLFDEADHVRAVPFDVGALTTLVSKHESQLLDEALRVFTQGWPLGDKRVVEPSVLRSYLIEMGTSLGEVIRRLERRLRWAL